VCGVLYLALDGAQDRVGDREPAVRPVELARLVEAARERGIRVAVKLLGDVVPRAQSGVEHADACHAAAELLPQVHQVEAGGAGARGRDDRPRSNETGGQDVCRLQAAVSRSQAGRFPAAAVG